MSHPATPPAAPPPPATAARRRFHRRQYIVDGKTQFRVAGLMVAGLAVLAGIQAAALLTCFSPAADALFDGQHVRAVLLRVGLLQFSVTAVLAVALGVLLSHRFVGAALVLRRAIAGMRNGDSSCRLTLRSTDFLHDVATDLATLRDEQGRRRDTLARLMEGAERALEAGDAAQAQSQLADARGLLHPLADSTSARVPAETGRDAVRDAVRVA